MAASTVATIQDKMRGTAQCKEPVFKGQAADSTAFSAEHSLFQKHNHVSGIAFSTAEVKRR